MMNFEQLEARDGLRFSWNALPNNRLFAATCAMPVGCVYTPLKPLAGQPLLTYDPVHCSKCRSIINPYSQIDFNSKTWVCSLCDQLNPLPSSYHGMTPDCLAAELIPDFTTVEYALKTYTTMKPTFIFVVDICVPPAKIQYLKQFLTRTIAALPQDALVGLISFGTVACIHELTYSECPRSFVYNGLKTYDSRTISHFLGISNDKGTPFLVPVADAELTLNTIIDNLEVDPFPVPKNERQQRCTGAALSLAVSLAQCYPNLAAHIMLLTSGPATKGPGAIAPIQRTQEVRQLVDIEKKRCQLTMEATKFYDALGMTAVQSNCVINNIAVSFEESGIYELNGAIMATGGFIITGESWDDEYIAQSLIKYFDDEVFKRSGAEAEISIRASRSIKLNGIVGPGTSGESAGMDKYSIGGLMPTSSIAMYFGIEAQVGNAELHGSHGHIQIATRYRHLQTGEMRLRITTARLMFMADTPSHEILSYFDQETAMTMLAKTAMLKTKTLSNLDVLRYVDRTLILFCRKFATYSPKKPNTFVVPEAAKFLPEFVYHFRRSPFLSTFNSSPDQLAAMRSTLMCETVGNVLCMIQPTLVSWELDSPPVPVPLSSSSLKETSVLLLDTYFRVLVWYGSHVASWREQGLHEKEEHVNIKELLDNTAKASEELIRSRFPTPISVFCDQDSSLSRYLIARCAPTPVSYPSLGYKNNDSLETREPTFANFYEKLAKLAVSPA